MSSGGAVSEPLRHAGRFNRVQPLVLGTVQIVIGLVVLLFGVNMAPQGRLLAFYSGLYFWAGASFIAAGGVTVAASKSPERRLITASMAVNILSAVFSVAGICICIVDSILSWYYYTKDEGLSGILIPLHFGQFAISVTVAGFACHATCFCCGEPHSANSSVTPEAPPTSRGVRQESSESLSLTKTSEEPMDSEVPSV